MPENNVTGSRFTEVPKPPIPAVSTPDIGKLASEIRAAIQEGTERWVAYRNKIAPIFQFTRDGSPEGELSKHLTRIEAGFKFSAEEGDTGFSELHIEPLIDQAADLLDRAVRDRATYDELGAKWMSMWLELQAFEALQELRKQEGLNGFYSVANEEAAAEYKAALTNVQGLSTLAGYLHSVDTVYFDSTAINDVMLAADRAAWLSGQSPTLLPDGSSPQASTLAYPNDAANPATASQHARIAADIETSQRIGLQDSSLKAQALQLQSAADVAKVRSAGQLARAKWEFAKDSFSRQRADIEALFHVYEQNAATAPNGLLNYSKRLDSLRQRFTLDFRNALARLERVRAGMALVYGYDVPLPADPSDINYFDDCLLWTRTAIDWLVRFSRRDQGIVMPVSIKKLMGESAFKNALAARKFTFNLPAEALWKSRFTHVRMRGISATVEGSGDEHLWRLWIELPASSTVQHLSGNVVPLAQVVPACQLARVTGRSAVRDPDVGGISALHNASPAGDWTIRLPHSFAYADPDPSELDDIVLHLHLAFRSSQ